MVNSLLDNQMFRSYAKKSFKPKLAFKKIILHLCTPNR